MAADRFQHLEQKLEQQDRDFLLTRTFARAQDRPLLTAVHSLRAELKAIPALVRDTGVALTKISWWQDEWQRLADGKARHPITQALQTLLPGPPPPLADASMALAQLCTDDGGWESMESLVELAERLALPFAALEACCCGAESAPAGLLRTWRDIELMAIAVDSSGWAQTGRRVLPLNLVARHQLGPSPSGPLDPSKNPALLDLYRLVREQVETGYSGCGPWHAPIYREVYLARLARLLKTSGSATGPSPLGRLWAAWRGARATRRQQA